MFKAAADQRWERMEIYLRSQGAELVRSTPALESNSPLAKLPEDLEAVARTVPVTRSESKGQRKKPPSN
jgi:hypothetical protein